MTKQASTVIKYHKSLLLSDFVHEGVNMKMSKGAYWEPSGILKRQPKSTRNCKGKRFIMTKQLSTAIKYHKLQFLCAFGHEGVNI